MDLAIRPSICDLRYSFLLIGLFPSALPAMSVGLSRAKGVAYDDYGSLIGFARPVADYLGFHLLGPASTPDKHVLTRCFLAG
jgi:hypothetical protein